MQLEIAGIQYYSTATVLAEAGISRQTLWRWRQDGKIPSGQRRYRDRRVLFTLEEVEEIKAFANRLEPIGAKADRNRVGLFGGGP